MSSIIDVKGQKPINGIPATLLVALGGDVPRALRRHPEALAVLIEFWNWRRALKRPLSKRYRDLLTGREQGLRTVLASAGLGSERIEAIIRSDV